MLVWMLAAQELTATENVVRISQIIPGSPQMLPFEIYWPLLELEAKPPVRTPPILKGSLETHVQISPGTNTVLAIRVLLTRPGAETNRLFWNKTLAFPQYDWMHYVRVWDKQQQWLWPNLPFLLRASGLERVERYGGWDPGKEVDNDFAAILIRKYDPTGQRESAVTRNRPLVSAEWHPVGSTNTDNRTIVHSAASDEFLIHLDQQDGRIMLWLIFADFMGAPIPKSFPQEPEYNGGILAFFEVDWHNTPDNALQLKLAHRTPQTSTRFNWRGWAGRASAHDKLQAIPRLMDRSKGSEL